MKKKKKGKWTKDKEVWQYQLGDMESGIEPGKGTGGSTYTIANPGVTATYGKRNTWQYCPHCGKELK